MYVCIPLWLYFYKTEIIYVLHSYFFLNCIHSKLVIAYLYVPSSVLDTGNVMISKVDNLLPS